MNCDVAVTKFSWQFCNNWEKEIQLIDEYEVKIKKYEQKIQLIDEYEVKIKNYEQKIEKLKNVWKNKNGILILFIFHPTKVGLEISNNNLFKKYPTKVIHQDFSLKTF